MSAGSAKAGTISRLIRSARTEFASKGLAGARVETIARQAGVTKQLIYHYYHSKEELFAAVLSDASCSTMPKLVGCEFTELSPPDALRQFLYAIFEQYRADPMLGPLAREGMCFHEEQPGGNKSFSELVPALRGSFERILARGIAEGCFRSDSDMGTLLALSSLVMTGGFTNRHSLSVLMQCDTASPDGADRWRVAAADFILAALRA